MSPRPHWLTSRRSSPGRRAKWARYDQGRLHAACEPKELAARCRICIARPTERHLWYQSRTEAETAYRLDSMLRLGEISYWRRAQRVTLVQGTRADRNRIDYTPDFEVGELENGQVVDAVWEVKGARCTCPQCYTPKPGKRRPPIRIEGDALLKLRMFRAQDPRPLRVIDAKGRPIHV